MKRMATLLVMGLMGAALAMPASGQIFMGSNSQKQAEKAASKEKKSELKSAKKKQKQMRKQQKQVQKAEHRKG
jgi:hypothetical protein